MHKFVLMNSLKFNTSAYQMLFITTENDLDSYISL